MSFFVVDVEADSKSPASGSMVCFGAVKLDKELDKTFYGETSPINVRFNPEALAISGFSREQHVMFQSGEKTMKEFHDWVIDVNRNGRPIFISDNLAFDWMWICYYFDLYNLRNPFGYSGRRIGDLIAGLECDMRFQWKKWRITKHDHNPVNDAKGNAEVLLKLVRDYNLNIPIL